MNVFEGSLARSTASLKCAMMLAARMAALSRRLQSSASSTSGPKRRVRGEACVRYVLSRPLAGLEGRPAPCLRNPIKKSELEVCVPNKLKTTQFATFGRAAVARRRPRHRCPGSRGKRAAKRRRSAKYDRSAKRQKKRLPARQNRTGAAGAPRRQQTSPWPASARRAPTPGRRSRASRT